MADAVDHLVEAVGEAGPVTLVGHSLGGYFVTAAAHRLGRERVTEVVYYNAVVPEQGKAMADENELYAGLIREGIAASPDHTVRLGLEMVPMFLPDSPAELQELFFDLLVPTPGGYFTDALEVPGVTTAGIPARYLLSENDQTLARPGTEFAARIGLTPTMLSGGHMSLLTHPDEVAAALLRS